MDDVCCNLRTDNECLLNQWGNWGVATAHIFSPIVCVFFSRYSSVKSALGQRWDIHPSAEYLGLILVNSQHTTIVNF